MRTSPTRDRFLALLGKPPPHTELDVRLLEEQGFRTHTRCPGWDDLVRLEWP
jgi:hypothetical protein